MRYAVVFRNGKNLVIPASDLAKGENPITMLEVSDRMKIDDVQKIVDKSYADVTTTKDCAVKTLWEDLHEGEDHILANHKPWEDLPEIESAQRFLDPRWE